MPWDQNKWSSDVKTYSFNAFAFSFYVRVCGGEIVLVWDVADSRVANSSIVASSQSPWSNPTDLRLFSPLFLYYSFGGGGVTVLPFRFTLCRVCLLSHIYCLWVSGTEIPEQGTVPSNDFLRVFLCRQPTVPPPVPRQHQARPTNTLRGPPAGKEPL